MFDGNFRSRREIDYSNGNSRRNRQRRGGGLAPSSSARGARSKQDLLRNAEIQRKQRQEHQGRDRATKKIQKCVRGSLARRKVAKQLRSMVATAQNRLPLATIVALQLSPPLFPFVQKLDSSVGDSTTATTTTNNTNVRRELLLFYAASMVNQSASTLSTVWFSQKRIVHAALQEWNTLCTVDMFNNRGNTENIQAASLVRIVESYCASWVSDPAATMTTTTTTTQSAIDVSLFLQFLRCARQAWTVGTQCGVADNIEHSSSEFVATTRQLFQWCHEIRTSLVQQQHSDVAIQKIANLFRASIAMVFLESTQSSLALTPPALQNLVPPSLQSNDYYAAWVETLVPVLVQANDLERGVDSATSDTASVPMSVTTGDADLTATSTSTASNTLTTYVLSQMKGNESTILQHALQVLEIKNAANRRSSAQAQPHALMYLLDHVFKRDSRLAFITSLFVRGEDVGKFILQADDGNSVEVLLQDRAEDDSFSDSDDEDEDMDEVAEMQIKKTRRSTARYSRKDLSTVAKLDRLYRKEISQTRNAIIAEGRTSSPASSSKILKTVDLARKIGQNSNQWLEWGLLLLSSNTENEAMNIHGNKGKGTNIQESYLAILGRLLQSSTGIRTNSKLAVSSTFMTKIGFSKPFLEYLWKHVQHHLEFAQTLTASAQQQEWDIATDQAYTSMAVFCDLFTHNLIAISDEDFLRCHTNVSPASSITGASSDSSIPESTIVAQDVIDQLRGILHQLYWIKPVLINDAKLECSNNIRLRLLLAGTKLWNALYERWNRLVRNYAFCEEKTWWFPYLSSRDGEGAVVAGGAAEAANDAYDDAMDIDENRVSNDDPSSAQDMDVGDNDTDVLAGSFRDPKMARILTSIPQAIPFDRRVKLFHSLLTADKIRTQDDASEVRQAMMAMMNGENNDGAGESRLRVSIHRSELYQDSMEQLNGLGSKLKKRIKVSFFNQHNQPEAGIDGGGVFKEFLDDLIKDAFVGAKKELADDADMKQDHAPPPIGRTAPKLFSVTPLQTLAVKTETAGNLLLLKHYEFLGRVLGKAVYESLLVEPQFCLPFLNQLLGKTNSLEDLKNYDPEYYKNLTSLRKLSAFDIENAGLTFELTVGESDSSELRTIDLIPGGRNKAVSKQNVIQYIHLVAHYRLNVQTYHQTRAFLRGFRDLIPASWVRLFSANELQKVIGGDDSIRGIDVPSLKRSMQYAAGYHQSQPVMRDFWDILENDLNPEQQRKFLKFMTSCSRQPLLGFSSLEPAPCIQQIRLADDEDMEHSRLPTSSTCMNLLKLPNYNSKVIMRKKLLAAIESGAGFELT